MDERLTTRRGFLRGMAGLLAVGYLKPGHHTHATTTSYYGYGYVAGGY